jgi:hypothetical protein
MEVCVEGLWNGRGWSRNLVDVQYPPINSECSTSIAAKSDLPTRPEPRPLYFCARIDVADEPVIPPSLSSQKQFAAAFAATASQQTAFELAARNTLTVYKRNS